MTTLNFDQKVTFYEEHKKKHDYNSFLPNSRKSERNYFGVAVLAALNLIVSYQK